MLLPIALRYLNAGISVIPCNAQTKAPTVSWKPFMSTLPTKKDLITWFRNPAATGIAAIAGEVSGNLEIIDFDSPEIFPVWADEILKKEQKLFNKLTISRTQSGGYHVYYRCSSPVGRNKKLARDMKNKTLVETRGSGGYALIPPSLKYAWITPFGIEKVKTISSEEKNLLFSIANQFDVKKDMEEIDALPLPVRSEPGTRPGDLYNAMGNISGVLIKHGWKYIRNHNETQYWCRPGKDFGISATFNYKGCNKFYVFSSNAYPFVAGHTYSPFAVYALLEWAGDFRKAAADLKSMGFCPSN